MGAVWRGRFSAKSVIVTGGASGIGAATAERFLREGASVLIIDSNMPALGRCMALLEDAAGAGGGRCVGVHGDVTSPSDVVCMLERALQEFGALDILISNAGVSHTEPFLDIPLVNWAQHIEGNLTSMFLVCQAVGRHMAAARSGVMLLTSSTNGLVGEDRYAHYNASKGGVTLLMKSMAIELGPFGVRVNAVCPGYIVTPMAEAADTPEFMAAYVEKLRSVTSEDPSMWPGRSPSSRRTTLRSSRARRS